MKSIKSVLNVLLAIFTAFFLITCGGGGDGGSDTKTPVSGESFTDGNTTLKANVVTAENIKTVTVTDLGGKKVLDLYISLSTATIIFPDTALPTIIDFQPPLSELPTDYTAKRMAIIVAGSLSSKGLPKFKDSPGCDWWWDSQCTLGCCAVHDQCYNYNFCDATSWSLNIASWPSTNCSQCNSIVFNCMVRACRGIDKPNTANNCYDWHCNKFYDCPPHYGSCDCKNICQESGITVPPYCGDGHCDGGSGEDTLNCPGDCVYCGNGICDGGETPYSCPSDCGGCGAGPYDCIPGSSMHYEPCLEGGVRECMSNCTWSSCTTSSTSTTTTTSTSTTSSSTSSSSTSSTSTMTTTTTATTSSTIPPSSFCGGSGTTYCSDYADTCGIYVQACCNEGACWYLVNGSTHYCCASPSNCNAAAQTVANIIVAACIP